MTGEWWLLDGSMLRGSQLLQDVAASKRSIQLYADMGAEAGAIGPWVVDGSFPIVPESLPLPMRLGISKWAVEAGIDELTDHAKALRHLRTHDGQVFYFRYADTRVLEAVAKVLPSSVHRSLQGPLKRWTWVDRQMSEQAFPFAAAAPVRSSGLGLTLRQFESLLQAGLPERLALALEELRDDELGDLQLPEPFAFIRSAAGFVSDRQIEAFALQRAIARHAVLTKGAALLDDRFRSAVNAASQGGSISQVEAWKADLPAAAATGAMKI